MPVAMHTLEHLLDLRECFTGFFPGYTPKFYFNDGAENEQFGVLFLIPLAGA
jgi:hypothetical protein